MSTIRIPQDVWEKTRAHLFGSPGEHYAFFLSKICYSLGDPVFMVRDVVLIDDSEIIGNWFDKRLSHNAILKTINAAVKNKGCLIEIHNHGGKRPRFSETDLRHLPEFVDYVHSSLPDRPYAATVWGDNLIYGESFLPSGRKDSIDRITVVGDQLLQLVSSDENVEEEEITYSRQLPWFTTEGQQHLARFRIGIVGCGGTGSHVIQSLSYLGCKDFVLVDDDRVEKSNMNRLVTAIAADVGTTKVALGRRLIKCVAPTAKVLALETKLQSTAALDALKGADVLFGCVDNDGARLILNELAIAYGIPYIDIATGIEANLGIVSSAGGRIAIALPGGAMSLLYGSN